MFTSTERNKNYNHHFTTGHHAQIEGYYFDPTEDSGSAHNWIGRDTWKKV